MSITDNVIRIKLTPRTDTLKNWTDINPVLLNGEQGIIEGVGFKIGDGVTNFNDLPLYVTVDQLQSGTIDTLHSREVFNIDSWVYDETSQLYTVDLATTLAVVGVYKLVGDDYIVTANVDIIKLNSGGYRLKSTTPFDGIAQIISAIGNIDIPYVLTAEDKNEILTRAGVPEALDNAIDTLANTFYTKEEIDILLSNLTNSVLSISAYEAEKGGSI